jgi:biopolymer transport protein ExbB/TolQ
MRIRTIALIVFILLVAAFVALNVDEFTRATVLSLGFTSVSVPLGLVMLLLLAIATVVFLGLTLYMQSSNLIETRQYARQLNVQRELADKAEASRFTELRNFLETQAAAEQRREAAADTVLAERFAQQNKLLLGRLEQTDNALAAHVGQLEDRLERRGAPLASGGIRGVGP